MESNKEIFKDGNIFLLKVPEEIHKLCSRKHNGDIDLGNIEETSDGSVRNYY